MQGAVKNRPRFSFNAWLVRWCKVNAFLCINKKKVTIIKIF